MIYPIIKNKIFGRLTVISKAGKSKDRQIVYECKCICGNIVFVKSGNLKSGNTKSCGCLQIETASAILENIDRKGEHNSQWKGGKTAQSILIRRSKEYKLWRESVFKRDNYTCIWCGFKGYVEADHIKPFALYPELRFAIDNGRTLCRDCHKKTDTYGIKIHNSRKI